MNTNTNDETARIDETVRPMDGFAQEVVTHFRELGFLGISEAVVLHFKKKMGSREEIEASFHASADADQNPPLAKHFEAQLVGHYSETRSLAEIRSALGNDFTRNLRSEVPRLFFSPPPAYADDPIAAGTKYDAMLKLTDGNEEDGAFLILLNDPDSSFLDRLKQGDTWDRMTQSFADGMAAFCLSKASIEAEELD
jgi:hypothetical protein